jgi:hypothetical protein
VQGPTVSAPRAFDEMSARKLLVRTPFLLTRFMFLMLVTTKEGLGEFVARNLETTLVIGNLPCSCGSYYCDLTRLMASFSCDQTQT